MDVRCVQCDWTIAPARFDDVRTVDGQLVPLHRGGCPSKDPLTGHIIDPGADRG